MVSTESRNYSLHNNNKRINGFQFVSSERDANGVFPSRNQECNKQHKHIKKRKKTQYTAIFVLTTLPLRNQAKLHTTMPSERELSNQMIEDALKLAREMQATIKEARRTIQLAKRVDPLARESIALAKITRDRLIRHQEISNTLQRDFKPAMRPSIVAKYVFDYKRQTCFEHDERIRWFMVMDIQIPKS